MKGTTREKVLGALLGVFVVLFVTVTVGWMWSCWTSKRRAGVTTETAQTRYRLSILSHMVLLTTFPIANRINELNYDINLAYMQPQNSFNDPTVPQLQDNQAYAESQQLPQNSDEPVYERISDLSAKYAQVLALEGDREEDNPTKALSTDVSDQTSTTVKE